jgi:YidC/Oxa1 family membrane protein insertase
MQQQQQGCMKYMLYFMPLVTAWFACTVPAAVGFYWIISTLTGFLQTIILNIWYSPADLTAKAEAQRVALLEQDETKMRMLPVTAQKQIAAKSQPQQKAAAKAPQKQKTKGSNVNSDDYLGTKK